MVHLVVLCKLENHVTQEKLEEMARQARTNLLRIPEVLAVRSGKRIRGHWKLVEMIEKRPGQWQQTSEITIEIEGEDKPALICEWITQLFV